MKLAILQCADTGPVESIVPMLEYAGYQISLPNDDLRAAIQAAGCDTVVDPGTLCSSWGYDRIRCTLGSASPADMARADLYVDIKGRNVPKAIARWPNLQGRCLWYRINGGRPEVTPRGGDEINLPCPILTPNLWYREDPANMPVTNRPSESMEVYRGPTGPNWGGQAYVFWPMFARLGDYGPRVEYGYQAPVCLIHNVRGWGYGPVMADAICMGLKIYGNGSPEGLVANTSMPAMLSKALCYVSLRSNDCPGYACYEALAAGCPCVVPSRLMRRMQSWDLWEPGVTCLVFDREDIDPTEENWPGMRESMAADLKFAFDELRDWRLNKQIGDAGRNRLKELMWSAERDGAGFLAWMQHHIL